MNIHAVPKPTKTKKKTYKGLQRKTPLKAKSQGQKVQHNSKKSRNKSRRATSKPIPEAVMKIARERSEGRDELDHLPGANQGHHIKHRSQNGLDIPINILHTSERNHPYRLHEDEESIAKATNILKMRIIQLFPDDIGYYHAETIAEELQTITTEQIERQFLKGWLKGKLTSLGLVSTQEQILRWLMP